MLDAHYWDALQTNLTQSINEGVNSLTMPDDCAVREGDAHTLSESSSTCSTRALPSGRQWVNRGWNSCRYLSQSLTEFKELSA